MAFGVSHLQSDGLPAGLLAQAGELGLDGVRRIQIELFVTG
jgi:hypothetical protein